MPTNGRHSWNVREMPSPAMRYGARPQQIVAVEDDAAALSGGMKPVSRLYSVVLPAPFGPRMPTISPCSTEKRHVLDRMQAAEVLVEVLDLEQRAHSGLPDAWPCSRRQVGAIRPLRQEEQDQDQRAAVDHQAPFAEVAQQFGQQHQQDRAADRPVDARHAADVDHGDDGDRGDDGEQLRAHLQLVVRVERAAGAGERRADHERGDLVEGDVDAGGLAGRFVAADRAQDQAPVRARQRQQQRRDRHQRAPARSSRSRAASGSAARCR